MRPSDTLSKDSRALLRAARGGDDIPAAERQRLLGAVAERVQAERAAAVPFPRVAHVSRAGRRSTLLRGRAKHVAWALAAVVSTGSLAALAHQGAFERLGDMIERVFGTPASGDAEKSMPGVGKSTVGEAARQAAPAASEASEASAANEVAPSGDDSEPEALSGAVPSPAPSAPWGALPSPVPSPVRNAAPPSTRSGVSEPSSTASVPSRATERSAPAGSREVSSRRAERAVASAHALRGTATAPDNVAAEELDLIVAARNALAEHRHSSARAAAERHAEQFAHGVFSEEREAILALCDCREIGATQRGRAFVERRPDSLFAERIRQDCDLRSNLVPGGMPAATQRESRPMSGAPR